MTTDEKSVEEIRSQDKQVRILLSHLPIESCSYAFSYCFSV